MVVYDADDVVLLGAVAAEETVIAQEPQIARARHRVHRRLGNDVFAREAIALIERSQQPVQVLALEAGQARSKPAALRSCSSAASSASSQPESSERRLSAIR